MNSKDQKNQLSIVLPAKNEEHGLLSFLPELRGSFPDIEIIVVDDGSEDATKNVCDENNVICICHKYSKGNGAAIKTGARTASGDIIIFMDADGQHEPDKIRLLIDKMEEGYDMVVGARTANSQASKARWAANTFYNKFASYMTGQKIDDLTSGFRAVRRVYFMEILHLLPNGFSYPTTSTMAFFRSGLNVGYVSIEAKKRIGKSHIKIVKDGYRFLLILFKIGTLYSPLKIFMPISLTFFTTGFAYYIFTFLTAGRFTNMSALLLSTSVIIFLIGLVSEQITTLLYSKSK